MFSIPLIIAALFFAPLCVYAAGLISVVDLLTLFITTLVPIMIGLAIVVFFWGIVKFIGHAGDERAREEGKQLIIWGLIALFVMVSLWAIVGFIQESLIPAGGGPGALPTMPSSIP